MEFESLEFIVTKLDEIMCDEEAEYTYIGYAKTVSKVDDLELIGFERKVFEEYRYGYKVLFKNITR